MCIYVYTPYIYTYEKKNSGSSTMMATTEARTPSSASNNHKQQQTPATTAVVVSADGDAAAAAAAFAVDFESVREAFDGGVVIGDELSFLPVNGKNGGGLSARSVAGAGVAALAPLLMGAAEASAKGGEFGIIEGRSASFFHPIIMVRVRFSFIQSVQQTAVDIYAFFSCISFIFFFISPPLSSLPPPTLLRFTAIE